MQDLYMCDDFQTESGDFVNYMFCWIGFVQILLPVFLHCFSCLIETMIV